jgi:transcriptional regulator with XRE-family HTH domain
MVSAISEGQGGVNLVKLKFQGPLVIASWSSSRRQLSQAMPSHERTPFARRLRALRLAKGFAKARHVADALAIDENRYTRYERGEAEPNLELIEKLCIVLRISPGELLGIAEGGNAYQHSVPAHPIPGFAEPARVLHSRTAALPRMAQTAAWRLASVLVSFKRVPGAASSPSQRLRETAERFLEISNDPYAVVVRVAQDPVLSASSADRQSEVNEAIEALLRALESAVLHVENGVSVPKED